MPSKWIGRLLLASLLTLPGDPAAAAPRDEQWYLDVIKAPQAHGISRGEGVTVGVLTSSAPMPHPDLGDAVLPTMRVAPDAILGGMQQTPSGEPATDSHATEEIGLIAARGGIVGAAPAASVRPLNAHHQDELEKAIRWLADSGAGVLYLNTAISDGLTADFDGIRYAQSKDVVVVMALDDVADLPAGLRTGVLVAGGVDGDGEVAGRLRSTIGADLRAPGPTSNASGNEGVIVLDPDSGGYRELIPNSGNETAAALVTGVVALVRSTYPDLPAGAVINRLLATGVPPGPGIADVDYGRGHGVVDAYAALTADVPPVTGNPLGDPGPPDTDWLRYGLIAAALLPVAGAVLAAVVLVWVFRRRKVRRSGSPPPAWS
ncbi:hypothetical protein GCM10010112_20380 [Actinoplanes lobatus]|uniref:Peptidase S8/S53 domain-containing protein n=1 Tax=Actinoplanes lobatus TaxID=113568 RepID=A0A7W7ML93_9ACTN|nr:S8 family serine peptidase [Actinoplanes lobatus]MBB4754293.1 hypothetical protein [Actinoplanes lobatus]GGN62343.1 hypothetical protein GCM10010112_20380 [Actinoplanes lobatus]GIE46033.1 hypothetical protein Alo02nite_89310 [Actinoplanes lobatus]